MVIGKIVGTGLRIGARYFPKTLQSIKRADVAIHKSLYGASGGRGVRHGRDIGSLVAGVYHGTRGDDLDAQKNEYDNPARTKYETRYRRGNVSSRRGTSRCYPRRSRTKSKYR